MDPQSTMGNIHSLRSFNFMEVKIILNVFNALHQSFWIYTSIKLWCLCLYLVPLHILLYILLILPNHFCCEASSPSIQFEGIHPLHHFLYKPQNIYHYLWTINMPSGSSSHHMNPSICHSRTFHIACAFSLYKIPHKYIFILFLKVHYSIFATPTCRFINKTFPTTSP